jgi:5'-3' exoribonuclease 2
LFLLRSFFSENFVFKFLQLQTMGVPAFFSWLVGKYPSIAVSAIEQRQRVNGVDVPADASRPNPNFKEFDNLYLDMNGVF